MRRMLREVPNCELTHADRGRDVHSRGWRTYVAEICDYIMVSPRSSRSQRQHGGREISFVSRRAARCCVGRLPHPSFVVLGVVASSRFLPDVVAMRLPFLRSCPSPSPAPVSIPQSVPIPRSETLSDSNRIWAYRLVCRSGILAILAMTRFLSRYSSILDIPSLHTTSNFAYVFVTFCATSTLIYCYFFFKRSYACFLQIYRFFFLLIYNYEQLRYFRFSINE